MSDADRVLRELRRAWPEALTWPDLAARLTPPMTAEAGAEGLTELVTGGTARLATSSGTVRAVLTESEAAAVQRRRALRVLEGGRS